MKVCVRQVLVLTHLVILLGLLGFAFGWLGTLYRFYLLLRVAVVRFGGLCIVC